MTLATGLVGDVRHVVGSLFRSPGHSLVVVATLAIAVGAAAAVFAVVREALLRPLPFREPDRLVRVWDRAPDGGIASMSPLAWEALRARTDVFETVGGSVDTMLTLTGQGEPETLVGYRFSADFFPMLGRPPLLGRVFLPGEDRPGAEKVVVLSHRLWQRKLGGDPAVVGRALTLSGASYTVIGVMPPGFVHPTGIELWTPFDLPEGSRDNPRARFVRVVARLREGRGLADARRAVAEVDARLSKERPDALRGGGLVARSLDEDVRGDARAPLVALAGAVGFVLLAAAANLAGLALARAFARRKDLAVRVALGAGRGRLLRESVAEWAVLGALGGGLALLLASWAARGLPALFPATIANLALPRVETVSVDGPVAAFALAAALLVSLLAAAVPAVHAMAIDAGRSPEGSRPWRRRGPRPLAVAARRGRGGCRAGAARRSRPSRPDLPPPAGRRPRVRARARPHRAPHPAGLALRRPEADPGVPRRGPRPRARAAGGRGRGARRLPAALRLARSTAVPDRGRRARRAGERAGGRGPVDRHRVPRRDEDPPPRGKGRGRAGRRRAHPGSSS